MKNKTIPLELAAVPIALTPNGEQILTKRFLCKDTTGATIETIPQMFWRVADAITQQYSDPHVAMDMAVKYYNMMTKLEFFPNSPTFTGAGTPLGQLAACFVLPITDDMGRDMDAGIFSTLRNAALIQQTGGGIGFDFSQLRPKGDPVNTTGTASGPLSFLEVYNAAFGAIAQGGTRRGANMAVLRVDHPDIFEYIRAKKKEGVLSNFNLSVALTNEFMKAVVADAEYNLVNPRTKKVVKTLRAQLVYDEIVASAHANGEPGVLFIDTSNATNPVPHLYQYAATNPCGEQYLGPFESCCLGSINLAKFGEGKEVQWDELRRVTETAVRFLNDVLDNNKFVPTVPQLRDMAQKTRRIGLGIMGLADLCYSRGLRYGSPEMLVFAEQVMEYIKYCAMAESIKMAKESGPFPALPGSIYDPNAFKWSVPMPYTLFPLVHHTPLIRWDMLMADLKKYGIRNSSITTIAPTGTISTVVGCEGYGCEPVFALAYTRHVKDKNNEMVDLSYVSPMLTNRCHDPAVIKEALATGSLQHMKMTTPANEAIQKVFVASQDISHTDHIKVQAALQHYVDNSISKTINMAPDATVADVHDAFIMAWKHGCKGLTVYVTGSRKEVVLETKAQQQPPPPPPPPPIVVALSQSQNNDIITPNPILATTTTTTTTTSDPVSTPPVHSQTPFLSKRPRPLVLQGSTYCSETPLGDAFVTVNSTCDHEPFEVFLNVGKGGTDVAAVSEAMGRLISLALRLPSSLSPSERLEMVASQLDRIGGRTAKRVGRNRMLSLPDAIATVLRQHMGIPCESPSIHNSSNSIPITLPNVTHHQHQQDSRVLGDLCPSCGETTFIKSEGCLKCVGCGYAQC
jgi:ribonucleoside-diphosphate reductase alpha chain